MTLVIDNVPSYVTYSDVREYIEAKIGCDPFVILSWSFLADPSKKYPHSLYVYARKGNSNFLLKHQRDIDEEKAAVRMIQGKYWGNQIVEAYYTTHEPFWDRYPSFIYPKSSQLWLPPLSSSTLSSSPSSSSPSSSSSSSKPSSSSSKPTGGQIAVGVMICIGAIAFLGVIMGFPVQIVITILGGIIGVAIAFNH